MDVWADELDLVSLMYIGWSFILVGPVYRWMVEELDLAGNV